MKNKPMGAPKRITETIIFLLILSAAATAQETETKITILYIPIDWTTDITQFHAAAETQAAEINKAVQCPQAIKTIILEKNCFAGYASAEESCSENALRQIEKCARKTGRSYDVIIGLTNKDVCADTVAYSMSRGTILSEIENPQALLQELMKETDLNSICNLPAEQNTLVLSVDLSIQNNLVTENRIKIEQGNPAPYKRAGTYTLLITNINGETLIQETVSYSVNQKIKYSAEMNEIRIYDADTLIYSAKINACSVNNICQPHESQISCPPDCTTEKEDDVCNPIQDGACDTDCYPEYDVDCPTTTTTTTTSTTSTTIKKSYEDCRSAHKTMGCDNPACETCVCYINYFCCTDYWHQICVGIAENNCREECPPTTTSITTTTSAATTTTTSTTRQETTTMSTIETTTSTTEETNPVTTTSTTIETTINSTQETTTSTLIETTTSITQTTTTSTTTMQTTTSLQQNTYMTQAPPETKQENQAFDYPLLIIPVAAIIVIALILYLAPIIYAAIKPRHKPRIGGAASIQHRHSRSTPRTGFAGLQPRHEYRPPKPAFTSSLQKKKSGKEERRSGLRGLQ